jgi:hypothetical protein
MADAGMQARTMSGRKYKAFKAAQSKEYPMDENAIGAALDATSAPRYPGDAAQLRAIATHAGMDQAMLVWWIKVPASRSRDWGRVALTEWTARYRDLLQHITTGSNLQMCTQCQTHPARLMAGVWLCSGGCPPLPARPPAAPASS